MATSSRNSLAAAPVRGLFAAGLLGVAEAAPAPCANQEIVLEAKPLEMDYRNNNAVLRDVVITQCGVRIQAAEANIKGGLNFENSHWTISGDVRITADGGSLSSDKAIVSFRDKLISRGDHHRRAREVRAEARRRHHRARPRQHHRLRNRQRHRELHHQRVALVWPQ